MGGEEGGKKRKVVEADGWKGKAPMAAADVEWADDDDSDGESEEMEGELGEGGEAYNEAYLAGVVPVVVKDDRPETCDGFALAGEADATAFMEWLIAPFPLDRFVDEVWERRPLVVKREAAHPDYYAGWFSTQEVDRLLREVGMKYKYNVDVTSYKGKRETHNANYDGTTRMADPDVVWKRYREEGCSLRVLHPQRWCDPLWKMLAAMERFWNCSVGCNTYLTPANSQGFSPHWDDIEAIVLQLEGRKSWKLYRPRTAEEALPRYSSGNFEQDEIGEPILEVEIGPGDLLYLPRGVIHQAESPPDTHSLHVTLSTNQFNTWADLLEVALPRALELASAECCELRTAPPRDHFDYMGVVHSDKDDPARGGFQMRVMELCSLVLEHLPMDAVADQMAKRMLSQRLPPPPLSDALSGTPRLTGAAAAAAVTDASRVKLAYPACARLCIEEENAAVYHMMRNPRLMHMEGEGECSDDEEGDDGDGEEGEADEAEGVGGAAKGKLLFSLDDAPGLERLLTMDTEETMEVRALEEVTEGPKARRQLVGGLLRAGVLVLVG